MTKREHNKQLKSFVTACRAGKLCKGSTLIYNVKHSIFTLEEVYKEWRKQQKAEQKRGDK